MAPNAPMAATMFAHPMRTDSNHSHSFSHTCVGMHLFIVNPGTVLFEILNKHGMYYAPRGFLLKTPVRVIFVKCRVPEGMFVYEFGCACQSVWTVCGFTFLS